MTRCMPGGCLQLKDTPASQVAITTEWRALDCSGMGGDATRGGNRKSSDANVCSFTRMVLPPLLSLSMHCWYLDGGHNCTLDGRRLAHSEYGLSMRLDAQAQTYSLGLRQCFHNRSEL